MKCPTKNTKNCFLFRQIPQKKKNTSQKNARCLFYVEARDAIAKAKKQVAKIKDAATRRVVSDALAKVIRQTFGIRSTTPKGSYSAIVAAKRSNANRLKDAYPTFNNMELRQAAYDKRNPHKKG